MPEPSKTTRFKVTNITENQLKDLVKDMVTEEFRNNPPCADSSQVMELIKTVTRVQTILDENQKRIAQNTEALYGNGKPGLVSSVTQLGKDVGTIQGDMNTLKDTLNGTTEKPGMVTIMTEVKTTISSMNRLAWIIVGTVIPSIVLGIIYLLATHSIPGISR